MSYKKIPNTEFVAEAVIESYQSNQEHGCSFLVYAYVNVIAKEMHK